MAINFVGYLFNDAGAAVADATVKLLHVSDGTIEGTATTTGSDGKWEFNDAAEDRYDVEITSGTSVRRIKWADEISVKEIDVRNSQGNTTPAATFTNLTNNAGNDVAYFRSLRGTGADNDEMFIKYYMDDASSNTTEVARMTVKLISASAASEDSEIRWGVAVAGGIVDVLTISNTAGGATDLTFDVAGDVTLDADGGDIFFKDGGTTFGSATNTGGNLILKSGTTTALTFSGANVTAAGTIGSGAITSTGIVTGTGFTAGSAVLAEAELELLDGLTAGTAIASKVVTTDASIDTSGQRNLTITGELDAATLDLSSSADIAGDLVLSGGADGALQFTNAGENSIKIPDNQASALIIEEANNAYITFVTTDSSEAITVAKATTFSAGIADSGTIAAGTWNGTAIASGYIAGDAITGAKIADNAIDSEHYTDGSIDNAHIADNAIDSEHYADASVDFAHIQNVAANSILGRNANSSGVLSEVALATTQILIGDGTGFTAAALSGDATMTNAGVVSLAGAQTNVTSMYNTGLILGGDAQTAIDFGTSNEIDFKADNAARLTLTSGALYPVTNNQIDLGTSSLEFKDAFFDGTVTADAFAGPLTGNVTGNASGTALTVTQAAQSAITSLGTLTALTVDDVAIDGKVMTMTGDTDDTAVFTAAAAGKLTMVTTDTAGADGDIIIKPDGNASIVAGGATGTIDSTLPVNLFVQDHSAHYNDGITFAVAGAATKPTAYMGVANHSQGFMLSVGSRLVNNINSLVPDGTAAYMEAISAMAGIYRIQYGSHLWYGQEGLTSHDGSTDTTYSPTLTGMLMNATEGGHLGVLGGVVIGLADLGLTYTYADNDTVNNRRIWDESDGGGSTTLYIGNASITTSSDRRIKRDIVDTEVNAVATLDKLRVVDFMWDDPTDKSKNNRNMRGQWTGMIAQEVVDTVPYIINAPRTTDGVLDYDSENTWLVEYQHLVPMLVKAVQELNAEVQELKGGN